MSPGRAFSLLFSIQTGSEALPVGPLIQMVPGLFSGVKTDQEADHSSPSSCKVQKYGVIPPLPIPPWCCTYKSIGPFLPLHQI